MQLFEKIWTNEIFRKIFFDFTFVVLVILLSSGLVKIMERSLSKILLRDPEQKKKTLHSILSSLIKYLFYFLAVTIILERFGISTRSIIAVAGVGSLAIGFGAQALVKDIISGLFILTENQFNVDDVIEAAGYTGTVEEMGLRTTKLRTAKGELCIIPNGEIRELKNYSVDYINAIVPVPIAYDHDVDEVVSLLESNLEEFFIKDHMMEKAKVMAITDFDDSAVILRVTCRCFVGKNWAVERELRKRIKKLFDQEGIEIPYNKVDVQINK